MHSSALPRGADSCPTTKSGNGGRRGSPLPITTREGDANADKVMEFDVNSIPYTEEAYKQKKYAFVSDYARFWIMYHYGGIYFDTDVEVIRHMDDIVANGNFMGFEVDPDGEVTIGRGLSLQPVQSSPSRVRPTLSLAACRRGSSSHGSRRSR